MFNYRHRPCLPAEGLTAHLKKPWFQNISLNSCTIGPRTRDSEAIKGSILGWAVRLRSLPLQANELNPLSNRRLSVIRSRRVLIFRKGSNRTSWNYLDGPERSFSTCISTYSITESRDFISEIRRSRVTKVQYRYLHP